MPNYIAITLGPIYQTLVRQRKTRSVFAASYFFSYTMRTFMAKLLHHQPDLKEHILLPSPEFLDTPDFIHPGCGLYPDRLILQAPEADAWRAVEKAREEVVDHLVGELQRSKPHLGGNTGKDYLSSYLKIYALQIEAEKGAETINLLNRHLDHLELFENFPYGRDDDRLLAFFDQVGGHFLLEDAFGKKKIRFDSLPEIATRALSRIPEKAEAYQRIVKTQIQGRFNPDTTDQEEDDDAFYEALFKVFPNELQPYHRYIAVVNVDGDNFGKHIGAMEADSTRLKDFSKELIRFGREAKDMIEAYGGAPVYIGGDDLLFFAPVVSCYEGNHTETQTIFDLVKRIDALFYQHFPPKKTATGLSPSLSYGISFSYYKYPLNEALAASYELLDMAKDKYAHPGKRKHPHKNAIAFKVLKHSGQYFDAVIDKDHSLIAEAAGTETVYTLFQHLLKRRRGDQGFINSITYEMAKFQDLLRFFLIEATPPQPHAVQHLFDNHLNEAIHDLHRDYINQVVHFVQGVFARIRHLHHQQPGTFENNEAASEEALRTIYSALRFVDFVRNSTTQPHVHHA